MGGGGGQQSTNKWEPWSGVEGPLRDYIQRAQDLSNKPLDPYGGQRVADLSPMMGGGLQMLTDFAMQGSPERAAGGAAILNATQGGMNPYATAMNPYMGENPYLQGMIGNSNAQLAQNFAKGTAAQTDSSAARTGAFGGSAHNEMVQDNAKTLGGAISSNTNNLLKGAYDQSTGLAENALNRATGAYDQTQGRALQGAQLGLGQQGADLQAIQAMIGGAAIPQQYQQQLLDAGRQYYQEGQQAPFTLMDFLGNALSRGSGGFGQGTQIAPGQSPWTTAAGLGAAGMGLFG